MKKTEQKVLRFIDEKNLLEKDDRILVALSGGPDSVFLLHFLNKYSKKFKISLSALHINHGLRGKAALADEHFCKKFTKKSGIRFYSIFASQTKYLILLFLPKFLQVLEN